MMNINRKKTAVTLLVLGFIFSGCGDKSEDTTVEKTTKEQQTQKLQPQTKAEEKETIDKVADSVVEQVETAAKKVEETAKQIQESAEPVIKETAEKLKQAKKESAKVIEETTQKVTQTVAPVVDSVKKAVSGPDGTQLYGKCISCHGAAAQNKALGRSQVIKGWAQEKISNALKGYKDGTYGGVMKGVMKSQVESLSDEEIEALAKHIASF